MNQHLCVPILPPVKLDIGIRRLLNANLMTDDETGLGAAGDDHVAEIAVVGLHIALTRPDGQALLEQFAEGHEEESRRAVRVGRAGVLGHVEADDADAAGGSGDGDAVLERWRGGISVSLSLGWSRVGL